MINLNSIPIDIRSPGVAVEIDSSRARRGLTRRTPRVLLIGNRLGSGAVNALTRVYARSEIGPKLGARSVLAQMVGAFMSANASAEVWAMPVADDPGATAATGTITFTAPATGAGRQVFQIAGRGVSFTVLAGDTATTAATALAAAVNAHPDLPVTAAAAAGVATLTARNKGALGNGIQIAANPGRSDATPAGLAFTIVAMSAGATDPALALAVAALGDEPFDAIIIPWAGSHGRTAVLAEVTSRWSASRMLDGLLVQAATGSQGSLATLGSGFNNPYETVLGLRASPEPIWEVAAVYGAVLQQYGWEDPARPFQTLALPGLTGHAHRFTKAERELLLRDGISTAAIDGSGRVVLERPITTYQTDAQGAEDPAYYDVNTMMTLSYLRWSLNVRIQAKYPRFKLADDGAAFAPGQAVVTPRVIKAELVAWFRDMEEAGLVENVDQFKADLQVERDPSDANRLNAIIPPDLVNQFRVFAAQIQFRL